MLHRSTRPLAAVAALLATAAVAGCAADGPDPAVESAGEMTTSSSSPFSSTTPPPTSTPRTSRPPTSRRPPAPSPRATSTRTATPGPLIASATWADSDYGVTLKVAPTTAGRQAWGDLDATVAWQEVLQFAPDANTPGMRAQFDCHWKWARILEPDKPTWNIEPWRPDVTPERMLNEGCNPGGPEV